MIERVVWVAVISFVGLIEYVFWGSVLSLGLAILGLNVSMWEGMLLIIMANYVIKLYKEIDIQEG